MAVQVWADEQRSQWTSLHVEGQVVVDDGVLSRQMDLITAVSELLLDQSNAWQTATRCAEIVMSHAEVERLFVALWSIMISAAMDVAGEQEGSLRLSAMLAHLAQQPAAVNNLEIAMKVSDTDGEVDYDTKPIRQGEHVIVGREQLWKDLPGFSLQLSEHWNGTEGMFNEQGQDATRRLSQACQRWQNLNKWVANLVSQHQQTGLSELITFGVSAIEMASHVQQLPRADFEHFAMSELSTACLWFGLAGSSLASFRTHGTADDDEGRINDVQWAKWQDRLESISRLEIAAVDVRQAATKALELLRDLS